MLGFAMIELRDPCGCCIPISGSPGYWLVLTRNPVVPVVCVIMPTVSNPMQRELVALALTVSASNMFIITPKVSSLEQVCLWPSTCWLKGDGA